MAMSPKPPRPITVLWFPFFFAAAFALVGMLSFAAPTPHSVTIAITGTDQQIAEVDRALTDLEQSGFTLTRVASADDARSAVANGQAAAGYTLDAVTGSDLFIASGGSASRASYLQSVFLEIVAPAVQSDPLTVHDLVPVPRGDVSGVGMFFFALPLLLVGLITSIVLLQFAGWATWRKMAVIAATGAFASLFTYTVAIALDIILPTPALLPVGFLLTQAIGWLTSGVAVLTKRFFMPISMTFVLILGIPSGGATVNSDMLPPIVSFLHSVLPFGQYIEAVRSLTYFDGRTAWQHIVVVMAWAALGAGMLTAAHRGRRQAAPRAGAQRRPRGQGRRPQRLLHRWRVRGLSTTPGHGRF